MKKSEFRQLIREEIRKVLKEAAAPKYSFDELTKAVKAYVDGDGDYSTIGRPNGATRAGHAGRDILHSVGFIQYAKGWEGTKRIDNYNRTPDHPNWRPNNKFSNYRTTDGKTLDDLAVWYENYKKAKYGKKPSSGPKPTKVPVSGVQYTDDKLVKFLSKDDADEWYEMFADEDYGFGYFHPEDSAIRANDWLKEKGYKFQMKKAYSNDDGVTIKWTIK